MERRQAKPLCIPVGRPPSRPWDDPEADQFMDEMAIRASVGEDSPTLSEAASESRTMSPEERERARIEKENEGLDIANTEGILPGGGMILMDDPTPQQEAYMARRLGLAYKREYAENLAKGIKKLPKIRPIRTGDLIP
jgi:hypothetical protein